MKILKLALIAATIAVGGASAAQADRWDHHGRGYHHGYDHHRHWNHHHAYYRHGHRYWR